MLASIAEREQTRHGQSGQGQNGHFHFRIRSFGSLYININIYYIVADFDNQKIDFDHFDLDHFDQQFICVEAFNSNYSPP